MTGPSPTASAPSNPGLDPGTVGSSTTDSTLVTGGHGISTGGDLGMEPWATWPNTAGDIMDFENMPMDLNLEGDIYTCYNDPTLPLTGIDDMDWAEVGKMFSLNEL